MGKGMGISKVRGGGAVASSKRELLELIATRKERGKRRGVVLQRGEAFFARADLPPNREAREWSSCARV
jgi:hypothetical protein